VAACGSGGGGRMPRIIRPADTKLPCSTQLTTPRNSYRTRAKRIVGGRPALDNGLRAWASGVLA
jgi:hypothetical protein